MYVDNDFKFVAVLNKKIELPRLLNALGHMAAGISAVADSQEALQFQCYFDADGGRHPGISRFPFIVLTADNSNKIRVARLAAIEAGVAYTDFVATMYGSSSDEQVASTLKVAEVDLEYVGLCLFGRAEVINSITRKFSLYR